MSTQRDELAREIFLADNHNIRTIAVQEWAQNERPDRPEYVYGIADGLLAAGWTKPRTITDDDGLRAAKAIGTLLRDAEGRVIERVETLPGHLRWYWLSNNITNSVWPSLHATVLYEPTA